MNRALFLLFLLVTAGYCRTFSANPPKSVALHLQGGKNAQDFDLTKPVGRGARFDYDELTDGGGDDDDADDRGTDDLPVDDSISRSELKSRNAGGNMAPDFDARKLVGRGVREDDDLVEDDVEPGTDDDPSTDDPATDRVTDDDDGRPELESRNAGGNMAPDFNINKKVGRGVREDDDDPSDVTTDDRTNEDPGPFSPATDDDGRPEELEKRNAGGNKAPDFDITKPVGRGVREDDDLVEDDVEPGTDDPSTDDPVDDRVTDDDDGRPELEARNNAGGWKRTI